MTHLARARKNFFQVLPTLFLIATVLFVGLRRYRPVHFGERKLHLFGQEKCSPKLLQSTSLNIVNVVKHMIKGEIPGKKNKMWVFYVYTFNISHLNMQHISFGTILRSSCRGVALGGGRDYITP